MSEPTFGMRFTRVDGEAKPAVTGDLSVVGIVGTAPSADAAAFPLNTPVQVFSDDGDTIGLLGTDGTLKTAIELINAQLGEFQVAARVVIVRVDRAMSGENEDVSGTITNIVGDATAKTGVHALVNAGPELGIIPRLIIVPGYTSQQLNGIARLTLTNGGSGYTVAPTVSFTGGGGSGATATAELTPTTVASATVDNGGSGYTTATVEFQGGGGTGAAGTVDIAGGIVTGITMTDNGSGYTSPPTVVITGDGTAAAATAVLTGTSVASVNITNPGVDYTSAPTVDFSGGGGGTGAAATVGLDGLANAVIAALPAVLNRLLAHAIVDGPATTLQAYTDWRETIQGERFIPVETAVKVGVSAAVVPASPAIAGIAVRRDYEFEGVPSHSWANQPVYGIVGPNRPIDFSLTDGATEGQSILALNGGVILRGEAGVETAIASGGFVYVGTDNCAEDPLWQFYHITRMRDFIHIMFLKTLRGFLGKHNIDGQTLEAIRQTMEFALRDLKADRHILGYKVGFTRDQNTAEQLRLGKFVIDFAAEEPPVLRYLGVRSARYRPALDALLDELLSQIDAQ